MRCLDLYWIMIPEMEEAARRKLLSGEPEVIHTFHLFWARPPGELTGRFGIGGASREEVTFTALCQILFTVTNLYDGFPLNLFESLDLALDNLTDREELTLFDLQYSLRMLDDGRPQWEGHVVNVDDAGLELLGLTDFAHLCLNEGMEYLCDVSGWTYAPHA